MKNTLNITWNSQDKKSTLSNINTKNEVNKILENNIIQNKTIKLEVLAKHIWLKQEEKTLPNWRTIKTLNYTPELLEKVYLLISKAYQIEKLWINDNIIIDWACPAWYLTNIVHALHPVSSSIVYEQNESNTILPLSWVQVRENWEWENLSFKIIEEEKYNIVEFSLDVPQIDMIKTLNWLVAPKLPNQKPVVITWRWPISIAAWLAEAYAHKVPYVACFQPWTWNVVCITHDDRVKLWDII